MTEHFITLLQQAAKGVAETISEEVLRDAAKNVRKCAKACVEASGVNFERFVKCS